jgi:hypothetical protein
MNIVVDNSINHGINHDINTDITQSNMHMQSYVPTTEVLHYCKVISIQ